MLTGYERYALVTKQHSVGANWMMLGRRIAEPGYENWGKQVGRIHAFIMVGIDANVLLTRLETEATALEGFQLINGNF